MVIAKICSLTLLTTLSLALPGVVIVLTGKSEPAVTIILACGWCMFVAVSNQTKKQREHQRNARAMEARLKESLAQLRVAEERERISRDLHDGVGAQLAGVIWRVEALRTALGLSNVRWRIEDLGGRMDIASHSQGTRIEIVVPAY